MTDDYKKGLVTGLAMQPLAVVKGNNAPSAGDTFFITETYDNSIYRYGLINFGIPGKSGLSRLMDSALTAISESLGLIRDDDTLYGFGDFKLRFWTDTSSSTYRIKVELSTNGDTKFYGYVLTTNDTALGIKEYVLCYYKTPSGDSIGFNLSIKGNERALKLMLVKDDNGNAACIFPFSQKNSESAGVYDYLICDDDGVALLDRATDKVYSPLCVNPVPNFSSSAEDPNHISAMICRFPNVLKGCMFKELFFSVSTSLKSNTPCYELFTSDSGAKFQPVGGFEGGIYSFMIK